MIKIGDRVKFNSRRGIVLTELNNKYIIWDKKGKKYSVIKEQVEFDDSVYIRVAGILENSQVNGHGNRLVIFVSGCTIHCEHCQNKDMQDFGYGDYIPMDNIIDKIRTNLPIIDGITISGGEPFDNTRKLITLLRMIRKEFADINIWCYSGYTLNQILMDKKNRLKMLKYIDYLVEGPYIPELDPSLNGKERPKYRGSLNQNILDVRSVIEPLENKFLVIKPVLYD